MKQSHERVIWIVILVAVSFGAFIMANQTFAQDNRWKAIYEHELAKQENVLKI